MLCYNTIGLYITNNNQLSEVGGSLLSLTRQVAEGEGVQAHQYTQDTGTQRSTMRKLGKK